jgi:hypothetical protein
MDTGLDRVDHVVGLRSRIAKVDRGQADPILVAVCISHRVTWMQDCLLPFVALVLLDPDIPDLTPRQQRALKSG